MCVCVYLSLSPHSSSHRALLTMIISRVQVNALLAMLSGVVRARIHILTVDPFCSRVFFNHEQACACEEGERYSVDNQEMQVMHSFRKQTMSTMRDEQCFRIDHISVESMEFFVWMLTLIDRFVQKKYHSKYVDQINRVKN